MASIYCHCSPHSQRWSPKTKSFRSSQRRIPKTKSFRSSQRRRMDLRPQNDDRQGRFMDFPYVSAPHRSLMVDLVSTVENLLGAGLLPCTLPHDVQSYRNESDTSRAALHVRSGQPSSPIDFILGSWIHCDLPTGGALNITSLSAYLTASSDAPNFLFELIRSSATSSILVLDLPPRKDLALDPQYLKTFYHDTSLESHRKILENLPEAKPYFSSSLYVRSVLSPTAIMVRIDADVAARAEEIVEKHVGPVVRAVLGVWLDRCVGTEREVGEGERELLRRRDGLVRSETIRVDLGSSLPRIFGPEVADRVMAALAGYFSA